MADAPDWPEVNPREAPLPSVPAVLASNAFTDRAHLKPNDQVPPVGILADPAVPLSLIGIAYPYGHIGGVTLRRDPAVAPLPEVVWRLVLDRAWIQGRAVRLASKFEVDGRFALRRGRFVAIAEDAV